MEPLDRRSGEPELTRVSRTLARAAEYLVLEQMAGRGRSATATREAVGLLCTAGEQVMARERRSDHRREMAAWMRGATLARAALSRACW